MAKITFIQHDGVETIVEVEDGSSIMNAAVDNGVSGIDGDCGGECSCATCHITLNDAWMTKLGQPSEQEESMLDLNPDRSANSRLACQLEVSDEIDGIVVNLPEFQY